MPWIDLDDVKAHLNKSDSTDDAELDGFIDSACAMVEELKGHIEIIDVVETLDTRGTLPPDDRHLYGYAVWRRWSHVVELHESPVLDVTTVHLLDGVGGFTDIAVLDPVAGGLGWTLDGSLVTVPQRGRYQVTYTAGLDVVPPNWHLAAVELVTHLWRGSQLNQRSGVRTGRAGEEMQPVGRSSIVSAMPYRVRELLGIYGDVVNEHVVIA